MCESRDVTDVQPCLIHVELLHAVSGPLYLSPGNQLVAWIRHAVYFHWTRVDRLVSFGQEEERGRFFGGGGEDA